jgi:GTP-binding protein Era
MNDQKNEASHRSGFVGIIGRANVGKSTILNYYLGQKISIVSPRPQTTRNRILGVLTRENAQVVFLDSPGFHEPRHALGRHMLYAARSVLDEADVVVVVIDARSGLCVDDERVFSRVREALQSAGDDRRARAALLAINKVDLVKKPRLLPLLEACAKKNIFTDCIPISATVGTQMDVLLSQIIAKLPLGPRLYEPTHSSDQTITQQIGELIREQLLLATRQEVPHGIAVLVDQIEERDRVTSIQATILVDRPGQKAIVIGRGATALKRVGQAARQELERLLGRKVYLGLWVKVSPEWRSDERILRELGYGCKL